DDLPRGAIHDREGAARLDGAVEVALEDVAFVAIVFRMLLPDERVGGGRVEGIEVVPSQRPEFHEVARQGRLEVERHRAITSRAPSAVNGQLADASAGASRKPPASRG